MENKRKLIHPRKRQKIFEKDNFRCVNCGISGNFNCLEVDHIIPVRDGGTNEEKNLQTLCYKCNMDKLYKKNVTNKFFLDLSPLERLELIKKRLLEYKHLSYPEFSVVFTQDELFNRLRLNLSDVRALFLVVSGNNRVYNVSKDSFLKIKFQRDLILYLFKENTKISYHKLANLLLKHDFSISFQQIAKIWAKFDKIKEKSPKNTNFKQKIG